MRKVNGIKKSHPSIYNSWRGMRNRCMSLNRADAHCYAAKGVTHCEEWSDPAKFLTWALENGWKEGLTLDRIDGDGIYEPSNCRWVDRKVQARNLNKNRMIEFGGHNLCISEWAEKMGISASLLYARLFRLNWTIEDALCTNVGEIKRGPKSRCSR